MMLIHCSVVKDMFCVVTKSDILLNIVNHQRYVEHCNCYIVRDMLLLCYVVEIAYIAR